MTLIEKYGAKLTAAHARYMAAVATAPRNPAAPFRRAESGSLYRRVGEVCAIVFALRYGGYGWLIVSDTDETRWADESYDTEAEAVTAVEEAMGEE